MMASDPPGLRKPSILGPIASSFREGIPGIPSTHKFASPALHRVLHLNYLHLIQARGTIPGLGDPN
jgi:hypothetical protein